MTGIQPYAVIFKAFKMDRFVKRQLERLCSATHSGNVYLMMDETSGDAGPIAFDRVIRYKSIDLIRLGFASHAHGALFWYNADYPLYYFQHLHSEYDVIVMIEYDAVSQIDIDDLVQKFRNRRLDFVAEPIPKDLDAYWWTRSMLHYYGRDQIRPFLICVALFSSAAVRHLARCRLRHGQHDEVVDETKWPVGESFVGTELSLSGFQIRELSTFGQLSHYDWWPPTHEAELQDLSAEAFVHPVLVGRRYVASLFKNGYVTGLITLVKRNLARMIFVIFMRSAWQSGNRVIRASKHRLLTHR